MALSEEARAAIKDAVDIVREDRMEKFLRSKFSGKTETPPGGPTPPPKKDPTELPKPKSLWWGEFSDDDGGK